MKILVLAPPMEAEGGIQQYTATLDCALRTIIGPDSVRMVTVSAIPEARPDGTFALRRSVKLRFLARVIWQAIRWRPDFMICTHLGVARAAQTAEGLFRIPYWIVLHGIEVWGDLPPAKYRALMRAQRLIANSQFTLDVTVSRHSLVGKETNLLSPSFQEVPPKDLTISAENSRPTVLTVGRLSGSERYKGHDVMLEAWIEVHRRFPDAVYVIVGDGDDRLRLGARAKTFGISDSVIFAGALSGAALQNEYERCHVFALPAWTDLDPNAPRGEGFGIVFLEAMSHGKPVVGPKFGAPAEFIHSGEHGLLVNPLDPTEVAQALIELLRQPDHAKQMGQAAREWVNKQFSYGMFCDRLRGILKECGLNR